MPRKAKTCPFCDAPRAESWKNEGVPIYDCYTHVDAGGDEERTRTHHCYMNQIRNLQTGGDTDYSQGWADGVEAMRELIQQALDDESDWMVTHPPMRRKGTRYEDTHKSN